MTDPVWRTLRLPARDTEVAALETVLEALGALAITIEAEDDRPLFDTLDGSEPTLWRNCCVEALFLAEQDMEMLLGRLAGAGYSTLGARHTLLADQDWQGAFRAHFKPMRFDRLWVVPSWHPIPPEAELSITLDPGMAFGTGTHPTTALCLEWLAKSTRVLGCKVLDYGCGSGILAIAASRLGAQEVVAIDLDPQACEVTCENAIRNACPPFMVGLPDALRAGQFDIVVSNLLLQPLLSLVETFAARLPSGGQILLSGLMTDQVTRVLTAYAPFFEMAPPSLRDDWALLSGIRR